MGHVTDIGIHQPGNGASSMDANEVPMCSQWGWPLLNLKRKQHTYIGNPKENAQ